MAVIWMENKMWSSHSVLSCYRFMIKIIILFALYWLFLLCFTQDCWCCEIYFLHIIHESRFNHRSNVTVWRLSGPLWISSFTDKVCGDIVLARIRGMMEHVLLCFTLTVIDSSEPEAFVFVNKITVFEEKRATERIEVRCCHWMLLQGCGKKKKTNKIEIHRSYEIKSKYSHL